MAASEQMFSSLSSPAFMCFILYLVRLSMPTGYEMSTLLESQQQVPQRTGKVWNTEAEHIQTHTG